MCPVVVVSFDLDGTLVDDTFVNLVWHEGIPQLYSLREGIPFDTAVMTMKREYDKIGKERLEWYNLQYWIRRFDLQITPHELLTRYKHNIHTYPEVPTVLAELKKRGFRLIVITNARSEFAELELKRTKIKNYFEQVFSATSDFGLVKKTPHLYQKVCSILEIAPHDLVHVGDDPNFDFDVPRKLGVTAFYLDRSGKEKGTFVLHTMEELRKQLFI